jgi:ATP adenylyltransferase
MPHIDIISKVPERFDNALKSGDLLFFPSTTTKHVDSDVEVTPDALSDSLPLIIYQYGICLCPALQYKFTTPNFNDTDANTGVELSGNGSIVDPFAPPYNVNLLIGELQDQESEEEFVVLVCLFTSLFLALSSSWIHG